jgi:hypothetical protein
VTRRDPDLESLRARLRADLTAAHEQFHAMADAVSEQSWNEPSNNRGWTNGQLLFHILLGFILVPLLARLLIFAGHLPRVYSRSFSGVLNFSTPLFNRVNAVGPRVAARILGREGTIRKFDRVHAQTIARLERIRPSEWSLTMHFPTRWDPRFREDMRLENLF